MRGKASRTGACRLHLTMLVSYPDASPKYQVSRALLPLSMYGAGQGHNCANSEIVVSRRSLCYWGPARCCSTAVEVPTNTWMNPAGQSPLQFCWKGRQCLHRVGKKTVTLSCAASHIR